MSNNNSQKLLDSVKKCNENAIKITSKRAIQKTSEEANDDLNGDKIADKTTTNNLTEANNKT